MVIDVAKGVEERTVKLMEVCRLRDTPIMTFINKLDREGKDPISLLDEIELVLNIRCAPVTWPIGMGGRFKGIYHLLEDAIYLFNPGKNQQRQEAQRLGGLHNPKVAAMIGQEALATLRQEIELVAAASHAFEIEPYLAGELTPVYFGSAINNFGIQALLDDFVRTAPAPLPRVAVERTVKPEEPAFTGFVFKIQANMDPNHRDRIAFMRVCSGHFEKGMKLKHLRTGKQLAIHHALTFMAGDRAQAEAAVAGDIIGVPNHGNILIGDTFTEGEVLTFTGIPHFAPELFRIVRLRDPLKSKALLKGLIELSEEGAVQLFRPLISNDLILGAVGVLQFDVIAHRLQHEYHVDCKYDSANVVSARWIHASEAKILAAFQTKAEDYLAKDA